MMREISLVYVSTSVHLMADDELQALLEVSRQKNAQKNITGMLLYRDGYFIQAIEGEEAEVMALYHKIAQDPRHNHCLLVHQHTITQRSFPNWTMGFKNLKLTDPSLAPAVTNFMEQPFEPNLFAQTPSTVVWRMLESFRDQNNF